MRALSIRQPYAELILRGIKTVEYRSRTTRIIGERFHIYATKKWAVGSGQWAVKTGVWSGDLSAVAAPPWMVELANGMKLFGDEPLPMGVIVGSAVIDRVSEMAMGEGGEGRPIMYRWHLRDVERARTLRKPRGHPQPGWFGETDEGSLLSPSE